MIKELIKLANHLDSKGLAKEADALDGVINKLAQIPFGFEYFSAPERVEELDEREESERKTKATQQLH